MCGHYSEQWFPPELSFRDFCEPAPRQIADLLTQVGA